MTPTYDSRHGVILKIDDNDITYKPSPNVGGGLYSPSLIVAHFTGSGGSDGSGDVNWFADRNSKVSAHFVIGRDGKITQCVPITSKAWHAGKSIWRGKPNCNDFSIGIEFDNWGLLQYRGDGDYYTQTGVRIDPSLVATLPYKDQPHTCLETYTQAQLLAGESLIQSLCYLLPSLQEIAGHEDIAPGRKIDPGPAFPMARMRTAMDGRIDQKPLVRTVNTQVLNVRSGPSTSADINSTLWKGADVIEHYEADGWSYVTYRVSDGDRNGYVASKYLL